MKFFKERGYKKWQVIYMIISFILIVLFEIGTIIYLIVVKQYDDIFVSCFALVLTSLIYLLPYLLKAKINLILYSILLVYSVGAMLGNAYFFYDYIKDWDTLLHFSGGVIFAFIGCDLVNITNKKNKNSLLTYACFGLFFSITISAIWEIIEFSCDNILGMNMQTDTIIGSVTSSIFGDKIGQVGTIENITGIEINGDTIVKVPGYLDIGIYDTMTDVIVETVGAFLVFIFVLLTKGKLPQVTLIENVEQSENPAIQSENPAEPQ